MDFKGKVVIVTGGAKGIGLAIANRFAGFGGIVVIADINLQKAQASARKMSDSGYDVSPAFVDTADIKSVETLCSSIEEKYGHIDVLVNNAGITEKVHIFDITEEQYERVLQVNLKGTVFFCKYVMQLMNKTGGGRIINIASLAGERGGKFAGIHYTASKGGVISVTKALALIGGEMGINVNAVAPGLIATEMAASLNFNTDEVALKRLGTPEEVADGVVFLASSMASYITGITLDINGGIFMR